MGFAEIDENAKRGSKCCKSAQEPWQVTTGKECFCVICMRRCLGEGAKTALRAGCRCLQRPGRLDKIAWHFKRRVLRHRLPRVLSGVSSLGQGAQRCRGVCGVSPVPVLQFTWRGALQQILWIGGFCAMAGGQRRRVCSKKELVGWCSARVDCGYDGGLRLVHVKLNSQP